MKRLQEIVADGGDEARFETIGAIGCVAGAFEFLVGALEIRECVLEFFCARVDLVSRPMAV